MFTKVGGECSLPREATVYMSLITVWKKRELTKRSWIQLRFELVTFQILAECSYQWAVELTAEELTARLDASGNIAFFLFIMIVYTAYCKNPQLLSHHLTNTVSTPASLVLTISWIEREVESCKVFVLSNHISKIVYSQTSIVLRVVPPSLSALSLAMSPL